jgi:hypothetical protein
MTVENPDRIRVHQYVGKNDHVPGVFKPNFAHVQNRETGEGEQAASMAVVGKLHVVYLWEPGVPEIKNLSLVQPYFLKANDVGVVLPEKIKDVLCIFLVGELVAPFEILHVITGYPYSLFIGLLTRKLQVVAYVFIPGQNNYQRKKDKPWLDNKPENNENKINNQQIRVRHAK